MTDALNEDAFSLRLLNTADAQGWMPPAMAQRVAPADDGSPSEEQILALVEQARQEGFNQGREEGRHAFDLEIARMQQLFEAVAAPLNDVDEHVEQQLCGLALSIGKQLCRSELSVRPELLLGVVREGVNQLASQREPATVRLNPEDCKLLRESGLGDSGVQIQEDRSITPGGCMLSAGSSRIDERLESRVGQMIRQIYVDAAPISPEFADPDQNL